MILCSTISKKKYGDYENTEIAVEDRNREENDTEDNNREEEIDRQEISSETEDHGIEPGG